MSESLADLDAAAQPCGNQYLVPSDEFDKGDSDPQATQATIVSKEAAPPLQEAEITDEVQWSITPADQDPSELYDLANSILLGCKQAARVSDLDTAILLLREAYSRRSGSLNDLAGALVVRFWHLGKALDLQEAFKLWKDGAQSVRSSDNENQPLEDLALQQHDVLESEDQDALEITHFGNSTLEEFHQVAPISSLDTAIFLHREALRLRPEPHIEGSASLNGLALALSARFYRTGQLRDLDEAIVRHQEALAQLPESHPIRMGLLTNLFAALLTRFGKTAQLQDLQDAIFLSSEAVGRGRGSNGSTEDKHKHSLQRSVTPLEEVGITNEEVSDLSDAALNLYGQFEITHQLSDLETAISFYEEILSRLPMQDPSRPWHLTSVASMLHERFGYTGQPSDLVLSVRLHQEALSLVPVHHANRPHLLHNFANTLCTRFEKTGNIDDAERVILLYREALELLPDTHPNRYHPLHGLASALMTRFGQTGQFKDVDEAISLGRQVLGLQLAPHPSRSLSLHNLANAINIRFQQKGDIGDVNEAITLHREALKLFPAPHPARSNSLSNLSVALSTRFSQTGDIKDLDEAISLSREALRLPLTPTSDVSMLLSNLAGALLARCYQVTHTEDLNEVVTLYREVLRLRPAPHSERHSALHDLGGALALQSDQIGYIENWNEAILLHREALTLEPAPHPSRPYSLRSLANALRTRFNLTNLMDDLDEAIALHREGLRLIHTHTPHRPRSLSDLSLVLEMRYMGTGNIQDLNEAISLSQESVALSPISGPDRHGSLNNLANQLRRRFDREGRAQDMNEGIALYQEALVLLPEPHPHRSKLVNNLGFLAYAQFKKTWDTEDLERATSLHREALRLAPAGHFGQHILLTNLAGKLTLRFYRTEEIANVVEAIALHQEALGLLPSEHPHNCIISINLGIAMLVLYSRSQRSGDLDGAITALRAAVMCKSGPTSERFKAAGFWARQADRHNHDSALEAYQWAIKLLPRLAMLGLDLQSRQQKLESCDDGLARDAAACAIRRGQFDTSIELLEEGRAIFWSQALQLRTPLDELRLLAPDLAQRLQDASRALERGALRDTSFDLSDTKRKVSLEQETTHYRHLNEEWEAILEDIRSMDGFQDFLRPKPLLKLCEASRNGPVVILNASTSGCAALVMTLSGAIQHIPLPQFTFATASRLVRLIQNVTAPGAGSFPSAQSIHVDMEDMMEEVRAVFGTSHIEDRASRKVPRFAVEPESIFKYVLAILWMSVVHPVIRALGFEKSKSPPRLWWCPTGIFTFLPIHAAGLYDVDQIDSLSEYSIPSYTPTLDVLLAAAPSNPDFVRVMVVVQPSTPGQLPLPGARRELHAIEKHVQAKRLVRLGLPDMPASIDGVLSNLPTACLAHFACHGEQDKRPLESALILEGGQKLTISRIMGLSMPNASLAFLSACHTAMGDETIPDEALHLAASMLFAGFRGAVATMWSMADQDGPNIAETFYGHLFRGNASTDATTQGPDTIQAARALHLAVRKMREDKCPFKRWVPFIHLGL